MEDKDLKKFGFMKSFSLPFWIYEHYCTDKSFLTIPTMIDGKKMTSLLISAVQGQYCPMGV